MKILISPDSFKNALSAVKVAKSIKKGMILYFSNKEMEIIPLSDGGDGFLETVYYNEKTLKKSTIINSITNKRIRIPYLLTDDYQTAIIESAYCVGNNVRNIPFLLRNTFDLGLLIKNLLKKGTHNFIIGLGGSMTNDLGLGMLKALGVNFFDENDNKIEILPKNLQKIDYFDLTHLDSHLKFCKFTVLCDVENPLIGQNGAAKVYAKQKGATNKEIEFLEASTLEFLKKVNKIFGWDILNEEKLGTAGGLAFAFKYFLNAKLVSGFDFLSKRINLENKIKNSDLVITGEGRYDYQSQNGKVVGKIIEICKRNNVDYIILTGSAPNIVKEPHKIIDISSASFDKEYSIRNTEKLLYKYSELIGFLLSKGGKK